MNRSVLPDVLQNHLRHFLAKNIAAIAPVEIKSVAEFMRKLCLRALGIFAQQRARRRATNAQCLRFIGSEIRQAHDLIGIAIAAKIVGLAGKPLLLVKNDESVGIKMRRFGFDLFKRQKNRRVFAPQIGRILPLDFQSFRMIAVKALMILIFPSLHL
jgi:hypothetical protein